MPQKLNKAGKMQDYIPKGNGDASGEYGTSNGTNKNFTTSDKKSKANVITENKSVVVENKGKKETLNKMYPNNPKSNVENGFSPDEWEEIYKFSKEINKKNDDLIDETCEIAEKYNLNNKDAIKKLKEKYSNNNKANVIDNDLTGKKENIDGIEGNVAKAEKVKFSSSELEKNIPNNMRWKEWDIVDDGKALYWITQQPFDKDDLDKFKKELDNTPFEKAYVMTRDMSTYDYKEDKKNGNLQEIVKGKDIKYTPLMEEMDTYWKDFTKKYGKK